MLGWKGKSDWLGDYNRRARGFVDDLMSALPHRRTTLWARLGHWLEDAAERLSQVGSRYVDLRPSRPALAAPRRWADEVDPAAIRKWAVDSSRHVWGRSRRGGLWRVIAVAAGLGLLASMVGRR